MSSSRSQRNIPASWPIPLLIVGVLLLLLGHWTANLFPARAVWSDEDAREYTRASAELHAGLHQASGHGAGHHGHSHAGSNDSQRGAAQAAFDAIQARRARATRLPTLVKYLVQATGIFTCALGVWGYVRGRRGG